MTKYDYKELHERATAFNATQEEINELAHWYELFGSMFWNGEYYDAGDGLRLFPIFSEEDEYGDFEILGYEFR